MKYYIGNNTRDALNNNPVEIKTTTELRKYVKAYNVVLSEKEANKMKKRLNIKEPKQPAMYEGCIVKPGALASDKPTARSTTGVRGVYTAKNGKYTYYQARITMHKNGKAYEVFLGSFKSKREAWIARLKAEEHYDEILKSLEEKEEKKS